MFFLAPSTPAFRQLFEYPKTSGEDIVLALKVHLEGRSCRDFEILSNQRPYDCQF